MRKTIQFNEKGIDQLPNNKPIVYTIKTPAGTNNYTGKAQRGRVLERLKEHLPGGKDPVPGAKVTIQQKPSIAEAKASEARIIKRDQPKHNIQGK
jgi:hypothetical protein